MKIKTIDWKVNFPHRGVEASKAYEAVEKLREKHGGAISTEQVVEAAKPTRHVLHKLIYHNPDSEAVRLYRNDQAARLLRSFVITYKELPDEPRRAFEVKVSTPRGPESNAARTTLYSTTEEAMKDPVARDALISEAIKQAMAWRRRFRGLHELQRVFDALDAVVEEIGN